MEYTEEEKKSLEFLIKQRDEAYGLMQFEDGELYQLAKEEFNNYLTIEKIIDKQQKEIEELNNKYNFEKVAKEEVEELLDDSMPKKKIRKKIKEIEDCLKEDCIALHEFQRLAKIDVLKELLGE